MISTFSSLSIKLDGVAPLATDPPRANSPKQNPPIWDYRLGKKHFFVNSEIWGMQIWRKKRVNYDKFEIATKQRISNI